MNVQGIRKTLVSGTANPNSNMLKVFRQQEGVCGARKLAKVGYTLIQQETDSARVMRPLVHVVTS